MFDVFNPYQLILVGLMICGLIPLVGIWVRYEKMPHSAYMLVAIFLWPTLLVDELIRAFDGAQAWAFLAGVFQFSAVLITTVLLLSVQRLTLEKPQTNRIKFFLPSLILLVGQLPYLLLPQDMKTQLLLVPPTGDLLANWMFYVPYFFSGFMLLIFSAQAVEAMDLYHDTLSEQVVDVSLYRFRMVNSGFVALLLVAFVVVILTTLAAFDVIAASFWQSLINLFQASVLLYLIMVLLERRRYAPAPFDPDKLDNHGFSEDYLRYALKKAEEAIIRHRAYKRMGLRLRQIADAAEVEPLAIAVATRQILKRNFRAFIYHYRLEYAKKVLMRTDTKVSSVAKRLGFNSEKYLSNMFIKYIQMMGKKRPAVDEEEGFQ